MKEKSFKFRESFGKAIKPMTDKQAGKLLKGLCNYAFDDKLIITYDCAVKSAFMLIKTAIDTDEQDRENGRKGGNINAEKNKGKNEIFIISDNKKNYPLEQILQNMLSSIIESAQKNGVKDIAKT